MAEKQKYSSEDIKFYVGKKIKFYREQRKMSQKSLATLINKRDNTISNYEKGISSPSRDALFAIANALDISVDDLFPPKEKSISLNDTLKENDNITLENLEFLKNLTAYFESLPPTDQDNLLGRIEVAVELFKQRN